MCVACDPCLVRVSDSKLTMEKNVQKGCLVLDTERMILIKIYKIVDLLIYWFVDWLMPFIDDDVLLDLFPRNEYAEWVIMVHIDWLIHLLVDRLIDWFIEWLSDWLRL